MDAVFAPKRCGVVRSNVDTTYKKQIWDCVLFYMAQQGNTLDLIQQNWNNESEPEKK